MMMICVEVLRMQTKREREREIWNEEEWANLLTIGILLTSLFFDRRAKRLSKRSCGLLLLALEIVVGHRLIASIEFVFFGLQPAALAIWLESQYRPCALLVYLLKNLPVVWEVIPPHTKFIL